MVAPNKIGWWSGKSDSDICANHTKEQVSCFEVFDLVSQQISDPVFIKTQNLKNHKITKVIFFTCSDKVKYLVIEHYQHWF